MARFASPLLLLLLASGCLSLTLADLSFSTRRLAQATAIATADARSNGGSATVNSNANAQSTGTPTTAISTGSATAGPGQNVVVNCNAFAKDSVDFKNCVNSPSSFTPVTFQAAPACNATAPNATCAARDTQGRCWNFENGRSCAYKDAAGKPLTPSQIGPRPATPPVSTPSPAYGGSIATASAAARTSTTAGRRRRYYRN